MKPHNDKTAGLIRLLALVLVLLNQGLTSFGFNPLPFSDEQIYEGMTYVVTVGVAIWTWWKHNNITREAEQVQVELERKKNIKKV